MSKLVESILDRDYVTALELFEERVADIAEKKLYEVKRSMNISEIVRATGKLNVDGNPEYEGQNTKADWAKYRKQNKSVRWNQNKEGKKVTSDRKATPLGKGGKLSADDIEYRRKEGYLQADQAINATKFLRAVRKYRETGKIDENVRFNPLDAEINATKPMKYGVNIKTTFPNTDKTNPIQPSDIVAKKMSQAGNEANPETVAKKQMGSMGSKTSGPKLLKKDRSLRTLDRYRQGMDTLEKLKARGYSSEHAQKKAAILRKAYRGARAKAAAGNIARGALGYVAGALQGAEE